MKRLQEDSLYANWGFTLGDVCLTLMLVVVITAVNVPALNSFSATVIEQEPATDIFWNFSVIGNEIFVDVGNDTLQPIRSDEVTDCIIGIQQGNSQQFNDSLQVRISLTPGYSGEAEIALENSICQASKQLGYKLSPFISKVLLVSATPPATPQLNPQPPQR